MNKKTNLPLEQYRDPWLFSKCIDSNCIGFYNREFYPLSNFASFKVRYKDILYSTSEHAYQAAKFVESAPEIAEEITNSLSAHDAQRIARKNNNKICSDWELKKLQIMEEILREKLKQNPYVKKKLLQSGNYTIIEDSPSDSYWGCGSDENMPGHNHLGKIWMKLRRELIIEQDLSQLQIEELQMLLSSEATEREEKIMSCYLGLLDKKFNVSEMESKYIDLQNNGSITTCSVEEIAKRYGYSTERTRSIIDRISRKIHYKYFHYKKHSAKLRAFLEE